MSFEAERLRILERVSSGELSPQEGSLQIAMLKVRYQDEAPIAPDDESTGLEAHAGPYEEPGGQQRFEAGFDWRERFAASGMPPGFKLTWPLMLGLAIPFLVVASFGLGMLALFLAVPTFALVLIWNALAPVLPGVQPLLEFWPTLGVVVVLFIVWSLLGMRRRARLFVQR